MLPKDNFSYRRLCYIGLVSLLLLYACKKDEQPVATHTTMEIIPTTDTLTQVINANTLLTASHPWYIKGWVYVSNESTLRIEPGSIIHILPGEHSNSGGLVITRGAYLHAAGTARSPIHISIKEKGNILLLGKAPVKNKMPLADHPDNKLLPGIAYGGTTEQDSSGVVRYVQLHYQSPMSEGLKLLGAGSRTVLQHVTLYDRHPGMKPIFLY